MYNFAGLVGGSEGGSYYGAVMQSITAYNDARKETPPNKHAMKEAQEDIVSFIDKLLSQTAKFERKKKQ